jgi:hypothetical protein
VTAISNPPRPANDFDAGELPAAETSVDVQTTGDGSEGEPPALGGFVVGSVEGALAADAFPDAEQPEIESPEVERPSHLRVAPPVKRGLRYRRRRAQLLVLAVAALSAASMFMLVTFHVFAAQSAFTLNKLETQLAKEQRQYGLLRDQVATLSSPAAVANGAQALGMVRAQEVTLLQPFSSPSFEPNDGLPVPPPPQYKAIDPTGP